MGPKKPDKQPSDRDEENLPELRPQDLETLRVAVTLGYYDSPRQCTMEDIAETLGITKSGVYHRISKAEREAVSRLLEMLGEVSNPDEQ